VDDIPANPDAWSYITFDTHQKGDINFWNNALFFFADFVFFVVQMPFQG
jgi:hypothetical protein